MKRKYYKIIILCIFLIFVSPNVVFGQYNQKILAINENNIVISDPSIDIKIREYPDGEWIDDHLTKNVGKEIEFKIIANSGGNNYISMGTSISLPCVDEDNNKPMFEYILGSGSPKPSIDEGFFWPTDKYVLWIWKIEPQNWNKEMTFRAKIKRSASDKEISCIAGWVINEQLENDTSFDSVSITGINGCCFPSGTKITLADGSYKNIEDVRVGDNVLSYDVNEKRYSNWRVKMLGSPVHSVININNGLIQATIDHPMYIKKSNGLNGWGAYAPICAENAINYNGKILNLQIGDKLYSSNNEWITIENIKFIPEPVQTYNILSFSGKKTYFANDILVYEEHPPQCIIDYILSLIGNRNPRLEQIIENSKIFNSIYHFLP